MKTRMKLVSSLKIWVVIYPSITLLLHFFNDFLFAFPLYQRTLLLTIILVPWMVFVGIPSIDFLTNKLSGRKTSVSK